MRTVWALTFILVVTNTQASLEGASKYLSEKLETTQVLFIGTPNHTQYGFYKIIESFLKSAVKNEKLKYVVLERSASSDKYLQEVSKVFPKDLLVNYPKSLETLCGSTEWAYAGKNVIPIIQKGNIGRNQKILLRSIDGMDSNDDLSDYDLTSSQIEVNNCSNSSLLDSYQYVSSFNREQASAKNFDQNILTNLKPGEKVIVIYNHAHLLMGAKSCIGNFKNDEYTQEDLPSTWLGLYVKQNPSFANNMKVVLIDEEDVVSLGGQKYPGYNGNGILNIRQDYRKINYFDIKERPIIWKKTSFVSNYFIDLKLTSKRIFDGYIWLPDSKKYPFQRDSAKDFLPKVCKDF